MEISFVIVITKLVKIVGSYAKSLKFLKLSQLNTLIVWVHIITKVILKD